VSSLHMCIVVVEFHSEALQKRRVALLGRIVKLRYVCSVLSL
jgi:hypothetical protein